jgi:hypothetical protein
MGWWWAQIELTQKGMLGSLVLVECIEDDRVVVWWCGVHT